MPDLKLPVTDPQVCARGDNTRKLILSALDEAVTRGLSCEQVEWTHVTQLSTLPFRLSVQLYPQDL